MKLCPQCETGYPDSLTRCPLHGAPLSDLLELRPGMLVRDTYRIVRKLGRGGMGDVYLAEQILLGEPQVLKFLSGEMSRNKDLTSRFLLEVKTLRQIRHKNVVDAGNLEPAEDGTLFFSMEFVDGPNLLTFMRNAPQPFDVALALQIARAIAEGLGAAHAKGLVHRDIKPENILMARDEDGWLPKIADFGIVATRESGRQTQDGSSLLTPFFAAPEQWLGAAPASLDGRTDLYALGGVLFEMLTGESVFNAEGSQSWAQMHLHAAPRPPSSLRPELAHWLGLDALVLRLLAKDRNGRPQDVAEVIALLDVIVYVPPPPQPALPPIAQPAAVNSAELSAAETEFVFGERNTGRPEAATAARLTSDPAGIDEPIHDNAARQTSRRRVPMRLWVAGAALLLAGAYATEQILDPPVDSRTLDGQHDSVFAVAFSPNGLMLASASHDNTIQLWDTRDGKQLIALRDDVESLAWSPDGATVAAGIWDNTIKLWDVTSGQVTMTMQGHSDRAAAVAFSPDGHTLASASWDKTIKLWDVTSGQVLRTLSGHTDRVLAVAFSPDGHTLASGSADSTVRLWDEDSGALLRTLSGHTGAVNAVAFSADGRKVASGSSDLTIRLWDASNGMAERTLLGHTGAVRSVSFSPIRGVLASASSDSTIRLWDTANGQLLRTLKGHSAPVLSVAFGPLGYTLASGSADKTVRLWDVASIGK